MDDEVRIGWQIDPAIREAMRLDRARTAYEMADWPGVVMEAEELLDESPDNLDALLLLGAAQLELADFEGAAQAYGHRAELGARDAGTLVGLAVARFNLCELDGAIEAAREALSQEASLPEAHYYLGLALERIPGRSAEAVTALTAAHQLDPVGFPFPLRIPPDAWQGLLQRAMASLPLPLQEFWSGVPVLLVEQPDLQEVASSDPPIPPSVTGLYKGVPPEEADPWAVRPEGLRLYTANLARCASLDDVVLAVASTLEHEARDWLGLAADDPL